MKSIRRSFIAVIVPILLGGIFACTPYLTSLFAVREPDQHQNIETVWIKRTTFMDALLHYHHTLLSIHDALGVFATKTLLDGDKISDLLDKFHTASQTLYIHEADQPTPSWQALRFHEALLADIWRHTYYKKQFITLEQNLQQIQAILSAMHDTTHQLQLAALSDAPPSFHVPLTSPNTMLATATNHSLWIVIASTLFSCIGAGLALYYYWSKPLSQLLQQLPLQEPDEESTFSHSPWESLEHAVLDAASNALPSHLQSGIRQSFSTLLTSLQQLQIALQHYQKSSHILIPNLLKETVAELQHISLSLAIESARLYGNQANSLHIIAETMQEKATQLASHLASYDQTPELRLTAIESAINALMSMLRRMEKRPTQRIFLSQHTSPTEE